MRISLFSIVGVLFVAAVYWAGSRNVLGGVIGGARSLVS